MSDRVLPPLRRTAADAEAYARVDSLLSDLGEIKDGWLFADSAGPTDAVLRDMAQARPLLAEIGGEPAAEIDDGDGTVAVVWEPEERAGSLVFLGNGNAVALASGSIGTIQLPDRRSDDCLALKLLRAAVGQKEG